MHLVRSNLSSHLSHDTCTFLYLTKYMQFIVILLRWKHPILSLTMKVIIYYNKGVLNLLFCPNLYPLTSDF